MRKGVNEELKNSKRMCVFVLFVCQFFQFFYETDKEILACILQVNGLIHSARLSATAIFQIPRHPFSLRKGE